jgi:hypothetical protein
MERENVVAATLAVITAELGLDSRRAEWCMHTGKVFLKRGCSTLEAIQAGEEYAYRLIGIGRDANKPHDHWKWL